MINNKIDADVDYGSWSMMGSWAKKLPQDIPTMIFNFSQMSSEEIKATIVHQFGHALGLGHALMMPKDLESLRDYLDLEVMKEAYGSPSIPDFEVQWTGRNYDISRVNYDEDSVMQYR